MVYAYGQPRADGGKSSLQTLQNLIANPFLTSECFTKVGK